MAGAGVSAAVICSHCLGADSRKPPPAPSQQQAHQQQQQQGVPWVGGGDELSGGGCGGMISNSYGSVSRWGATSWLQRRGWVRDRSVGPEEEGGRSWEGVLSTSPLSSHGHVSAAVAGASTRIGYGGGGIRQGALIGASGLLGGGMGKLVRNRGKVRSFKQAYLHLTGFGGSGVFTGRRLQRISTGGEGEGGGGAGSGCGAGDGGAAGVVEGDDVARCRELVGGWVTIRMGLDRTMHRGGRRERKVLGNAGGGASGEGWQQRDQVGEGWEDPVEVTRLLSSVPVDVGGGGVGVGGEKRRLSLQSRGRRQQKAEGGGTGRGAVENDGSRDAAVAVPVFENDIYEQRHDGEWVVPRDVFNPYVEESDMAIAREWEGSGVKEMPFSEWKERLRRGDVQRITLVDKPSKWWNAGSRKLLIDLRPSSSSSSAAAPGSSSMSTLNFGGTPSSTKWRVTMYHRNQLNEFQQDFADFQGEKRILETRGYVDLVLAQPKIRNVVEVLPTSLVEYFRLAGAIAFVFAALSFLLVEGMQIKGSPEKWASDVWKMVEFGQSKDSARKDGKTGIAFSDVAGIDHIVSELKELVQYLRNPDRFSNVGAKPPHGVLLEGPPGCGKTLLAKAIAGEAGVPFFEMAGSEFVEVLVGIGSSRVRDLFRRARMSKPAVVFIDEIDALGATRAAGSASGYYSGTQEREQTLNQLLVELDGFDSGDGVIFIGATNRADLLDPALRRPGRFDRTIRMSPPDAQGRLGILRVHARKMKLASDVDLWLYAGNLIGFSGAELAHLMNEAAINALRSGRTEVAREDIDSALDVMVSGHGAKRLPEFTNQTRRFLACQELGTALAATVLARQGAQIERVGRVSIVAKPTTFSRTIFSRLDDEKYSFSRRFDLLVRMQVMLAGRAAEQLVWGNDSSSQSAENLQKAAWLARKMVSNFCLEGKIVMRGEYVPFGPIQYERPYSGVPLDFDGGLFTDQGQGDPMANPMTKNDIDARTITLVEKNYEAVLELLRPYKRALLAGMDILLEKDEMYGEEIEALIDAYPPELAEHEEEEEQEEEEEEGVETLSDFEEDISLSALSLSHDDYSEQFSEFEGQEEWEEEEWEEESEEGEQIGIEAVLAELAAEEEELLAMGEQEDAEEQEEEEEAEERVCAVMGQGGFNGKNEEQEAEKKERVCSVAGQGFDEEDEEQEDFENEAVRLRCEEDLEEDDEEPEGDETENLTRLEKMASQREALHESLAKAQGAGGGGLIPGDGGPAEGRSEKKRMTGMADETGFVSSWEKELGGVEKGGVVGNDGGDESWISPPTKREEGKKTKSLRGVGGRKAMYSSTTPLSRSPPSSFGSPPSSLVSGVGSSITGDGNGKTAKAKEGNEAEGEKACVGGAKMRMMGSGEDWVGAGRGGNSAVVMPIVVPNLSPSSSAFTTTSPSSPASLSSGSSLRDGKGLTSNAARAVDNAVDGTERVVSSTVNKMGGGGVGEKGWKKKGSSIRNIFRRGKTEQ